MTKCSHWLGAGALVWFAALSACGSKGGGGNGNGQGVSGSVASACLGQYTGSACSSCLDSACSSQLGAFGSDCGDYIDCYCPNGQYSASAQTSQACVSKVTVNPSCLSAAQAINSCLQSSCSSSCLSTGSSGSSGGGGGTGAGSGGGSSGGGNVAACGVVFTGASCASCVMSKCCQATQTCAQDMACVSIITCIHQCGATTSCEQNCISNAPNSAQQEINAAASCWASSCNGSC